MESADPASEAAFEALRAHAAYLLGISRTVCSVLLGVLVWEYLTTLHLEWRAIWSRPKKFTLLNICFLITRYGMLGYTSGLLYFEYWPNGTAESCGKLYYYCVYAQIVLYCSSGIIMVARVWAIWERRRSILAGMSAVLISMLAVMLWAPSDVPRLQMFPGLTYCLPGPEAGADHYWIFYMMDSIFDFTCWSAVSWRLASIWKAGGRSNLTRTLLRDQYMFFALTFATGLLNLTYYLAVPPNGPRVSLSTLALTMQCISVCRMLLNIRTLPGNLTSISHSDEKQTSRTIGSLLRKRTRRNQDPEANVMGTFPQQEPPRGIEIAIPPAAARADSSTSEEARSDRERQKSDVYL